jgi:hypothetical protein
MLTFFDICSTEGLTVIGPFGFYLVKKSCRRDRESSCPGRNTLYFQRLIAMAKKPAPGQTPAGAFFREPGIEIASCRVPANHKTSSPKAGQNLSERIQGSPEECRGCP